MSRQFMEAALEFITLILRMKEIGFH